MSSASRPNSGLIAYGFDDRVEALFSVYAVDRAVELARTVRVERDRARVVRSAGEIDAPSSVDVTVGDWVCLDERGVVVECLDRWSRISRVDPKSYGRSVDSEQILCANVDVVFVVEPLDRALRPAHVDRVLALVWESGATPVVVLTKADAIANAALEAEHLETELFGVDVLVTSSVNGEGVDALRARLQPNRTGVLLGASGAGKSTLVNALVGDGVLATGAVRDQDQRGRHTTTSRELVPIPGGGVLIDTPGLRSIGLWDAADGVAATFGDIEAIAVDCRFSDCGHATEPGCAVVAAVAADELSAARVERWRKLARETAWADARQDPSGRAALRAQQRSFNKLVRNDAYRRRKR